MALCNPGPDPRWRDRVLSRGGEETTEAQSFFLGQTWPWENRARRVTERGLDSPQSAAFALSPASRNVTTTLMWYWGHGDRHEAGSRTG